MNVSFATNDPFNSRVVNEGSGALLFEISTPFRLGKRTTTVRDASRQVVGVYQRRRGHNMVTYRGETRELAEWLPKKGHRSSSRMFVAPNGKTYRWKQRSGSRSFRLLDAQSEMPVAESHSAKRGFFTERRNMRIEVDPEAAPFLDAVVLSFIVCEEERLQRAASAHASAAAGASANAAAAASANAAAAAGASAAASGGGGGGCC